MSKEDTSTELGRLVPSKRWRKVFNRRRGGNAKAKEVARKATVGTTRDDAGTASGVDGEVVEEAEGAAGDADT